MSDKVNYNKEDKSLEIVYTNYGGNNRNYGELFDFLGKFDIVTASEIGKDHIVMSGNVYLFTEQDEGVLAKDGKVTLQYDSSLEDFKDSHPNFYNWYY